MKLGIEEDISYESFICTLRYSQNEQPADAFTEQTAILVSTCDALDFSTVTRGNFNTLRLKSEKCPSDYELSYERSSTSSNSVTCTFSRDFEQEGLQSIEMDKDIVY